MRSTKDQLVEKRRSYACEKQCFPVEPSGCRRGASHMMEKLSSSTKILICLISIYLSYSPCLFRFFLYVSDSPLVSMEIPLRTAYGQNGRCGMQPKAKTVFARRRS
ncbi:hypothetical protein TNCV_4256611 [Trichonephila clavipes]|nr:hypothetical protein TNCV_4256611 [Trichonephila clavipes]